ncbi:MAG: c-type cytochrome [Rhodanobacteraceae bacterium]
MLRVALSSMMLAAACCASAQPPAQLGLCAACHGASGIAVAKGVPDLAGQDADYLAAALAQYRAGDRSNSAMHAVAGALSKGDIEALARWYSAQPACPGSAR